MFKGSLCPESVSQTLEACLGPKPSHPGLLFSSRVAEHKMTQHFSAMLPVKRKGYLFFTGPFLLQKCPSDFPFLTSLDRSRPHVHTLTAKNLAKQELHFQPLSWGEFSTSKDELPICLSHCVISHISYRRFIR